MSNSTKDAWEKISQQANNLVATGIFQQEEVQAVLGAIRAPSQEQLPKATRTALQWASHTRQEAGRLDLVIRGLATVDFDDKGKMAIKLTEIGERVVRAVSGPDDGTRH